MVISIATRSTSLRSKAEWESRLERVMSLIEGILRAHPGFVSAEFRWGVHDEDGQVTNITAWATETDALNYVRGGGAASVDAIDQSVVPSTPDFRNAPRRFTFSPAAFTISH